MHDGEEQGTFHGSIREPAETDLPAIRAILETWIRDPTSGRILEAEVEEGLLQFRLCERADRPPPLIAKTSDGEVVGVVGCRSPDEAMRAFSRSERPIELVHLYVAAGRQGTGIGRALVAELERRATEVGYPEVILNSGPRYQASGWGFYDRLGGYERRGVATRRYGTGGDALVWGKMLGPLADGESGG